MKHNPKDFLSRFRSPLSIVGVTALLDIIGRFALGFDMVRVSSMEAFLFSAAGVLLLKVSRAETNDHRVNRTALILAALFVVAALRAGVWAITANVFVANMAVLAAGLFGMVFWIWKRRS